MSHTNVDLKEKVCDLPNTTLSIWKVHPDALREQDKNARIMETKVFQRLTENIRNNKQLESLPYCCKSHSPGGSLEFSIISGHHRVRAARKAGLTELFVLVDEQKLTRPQIVAKQLAHNSLAGHDDQQMLIELFQAIDDVNAKLEAGLFDLELDIKDINVKADDISFSYDFEQVTLLFLCHEYEDFKKLLDEIDNLTDNTEIYLAHREQFDRYKEMIQAVSKKENVRNLTAIMAKMTAIVREALREKKKKEKNADEIPQPLLGSL